VRVVYRAPRECPSQAQFERAVGERGARFDQAPDALGGAELSVAVSAGVDGFVGSLALTGVSPLPEPRALHASGCEEVVRGLAVITALLLRAEPREASTGPTESEQAAAPAAVADEPAATAPASTQRASLRLENIGQFEDEGVEVEAGTVRFERALSYTLAGGVDVGLIPGLAMPRFDLALSRASVVTLPGGDRYLVGGWVPRARWTVLGSSTYRSGDTSVDLLGLKAAFGGCSSLVYDLDGLVLLMCGEVGAGVMRLTTTDAPGVKPRETFVGLGGGGLELNARYNIGSVFHIDAHIGGELTLPGIRAERADGSEIFSASLWSAHALLGMGLHI
jgi:hypothetical protein